MTSQSIIVIDNTNPSVVYDGHWTQIQTVSSWSNEFNRTTHRADQIGATGSFTYIGGDVAVVGTLESPGTYGYPSITYTIDDGAPVTPDLSTLDICTNVTDITPGAMLYLSDSLNQGTHALKWTVNNASGAGPKFYLDAFYIYSPEGFQSDADFNMINSSDCEIFYNGGEVHQGGFMGDWKNNAPSFTYNFTGTGICIYGTLFPDQNPPVQIDIQLDNRQKSFTLPTTSHKILAAPIYRMERLELGQHTITVTTPSSSYWKFDYFLVQTVTLQSPDFLYSSNYGNISSCPGSENGTLIPDPHSTAALQSVFVSYTLSDHTLVPKQTYTTSLPGTTSSAPSTGTGDLPNHPNLQKRVIIGAVLGSVTSAMLVILLLWRVCRRRNLRRANLLGTGRSVNYMDSAESMVMARPFYIRQLTTKVGMKLDGGKEKRGDRTSGTSSIPQPIPEKNRRQQQQSSGSSRAVSPPVGTNPPSAPRNIIEIEAPARIPVHESMGTRREPEPGLGPETPQEERRRRRQVIRESDAGISLDPAIDDNGNKESVEVLPPAYEHHRGSRQYTS